MGINGWLIKAIHSEGVNDYSVTPPGGYVCILTQLLQKCDGVNLQL